MQLPLMILVTLGLFSVTNPLQSQNKWGFEAMVNTLLSGEIDTISSGRLKSRLNEGNVVLLDTRSLEEYRVSHIPGALFVGYEDFSLESISDIGTDETIVVSCAIGKRSEEIGEKLKAAGYENVLNHYGGIFDWTNRGFTVVDDEGKSVELVHPYNAIWGIWVNNYDKVYEPK